MTRTEPTGWTAVPARLAAADDEARRGGPAVALGGRPELWWNRTSRSRSSMVGALIAIPAVAVLQLILPGVGIPRENYR